MNAKICLECGSALHVRRGLCRSCRKRAPGSATLQQIEAPEVEPKLDRPAEVEPPRARPWVHKGSGTG